MKIKDRVEAYINYKGIKPIVFERNCGLGNGFVSKIGDTIRKQKLEMISKAYPDLNIEWIEHEKGTMILGEEQESKEKSKIPFYDITSVGGRDMEVALNSVSEPTSYINAGDWFIGATAAMRHTGDSMTQYPQGCILALKEVFDRELIVPGKDYVIETDEYRVTKQIQLLEDGYYTAYSTNKEKYDDGNLINPPFKIPIKKVRHILLVLGYVVNENGNSIFHSNNKV